MTLSITGAATTINQKVGAIIYPLKSISIVDSQPPNKVKQSFTVTIRDLATGQLTDDDGVLVTNTLVPKHTAPGTYVFSDDGTEGSPTTFVRALHFSAPASPNTAVYGVSITDGYGQTAANASTQVVNAVPPTSFTIADQTTGITQGSLGTRYNGPLSVSTQYIVQSEKAAIAADNLNITAITPNVFIHSGSGADAINVSGVGGTNVLDGSTGSNFLQGSTTGKDTFFVDDRSPPGDIWSTIVNFHKGDTATVFGVTAATPIAQVDNQGTAGYSGLTFHASPQGAPQASFTLTGYTAADLSNGRLSLSYSTEPDGTPFLVINGLA